MDGVGDGVRALGVAEPPPRLSACRLGGSASVDFSGGALGIDGDSGIPSYD